MKIPSKLESVTMLISIDSCNRQEIETIANGLISKVNNDFRKQGYSVDDAFVVGSENGYKGEFYIAVRPINDLGDSQIVVIDEELSKQFDKPTLESLTASLIQAVRERDKLLSAYVRRSEIPGLDFLENYIKKVDFDKYILKR